MKIGTANHFMKDIYGSKIYSSDETRKAPATLVTHCYVPHFHQYGDITIEKIMKMCTCE